MRLYCYIYKEPAFAGFFVFKGHDSIGKEHIENNTAVRKMLRERGVKPENLPALEDVKKVQRRLESEEKRVSKTDEKLTKRK